MEVVKWIMLIGLIALAIYLTIDTILFARKRIKERKKKKAQEIEQKPNNNDEIK